MTDSSPAPFTIIGEGTPVILVPGMDGTGQLFYRQVPLLARSFSPVTYALRHSAVTMDELVSDLDRIVEAVGGGDQRPILVGESFGGALAMTYAIARPERLRGLVILNSFPYFAPQWRLWVSIAALQTLPMGTMGLVRRLTAMRLHSAHTHHDDIVRFLQLTRETSREGYLNRLRILRSYDVRTRLREINVPTLFLASECDRLIPSVAQARLMAASVPSATMRVLERHGHICLIAPDLDLSELLREWMHTWHVPPSRARATS